MKNICIAIAAAVATSSSSSSTTTCTARTTTTGFTTIVDPVHVGASSRNTHMPWIGGIPRGGGGANNEDDNNNDKTDDTSKNKPKSNKKKKKKQKSSKQQQHQDSSDKKKQDNNQQSSSSSSSSSVHSKNKIVEEILQHDDFYQVLGIGNTANEREITKAYRRRCVQTHPDKTGGDRRAFDKVAEAYDVLSDDHKRQLYNRYGKQGLDSHVGGSAATAASSYQDVFRNMFQQAAEQRRQQQRKRNQTLRYQLQVSLEDLYHGRTQSVVVSPPHYHHSYQHSSSSSSSRQKEVDVHVPKGSISGQSIVLSGEVDFNDDTTPGDLVFILTQAPHSTFTRKGHDLVMEVTIGLQEALCGMVRPIQHLNGETVWIESAKSSTQDGNPIIIQTGDVQVLKGYGMPKRNQPGEYGDLYIQYRVEMPKNDHSRFSSRRSSNTLTEDEMKELSRLLSKLEGKGSRPQLPKKLKRKQKSAASVIEENPDFVATDENNEESEEKESEGGIHLLHEAKASDFGVASGRVVWDDEENEGFHEDHGDDFHPFASAASSFFGGGNGRGSGAFYFGGTRNFGNYYNNNGDGDDDGNVQCQQM
jgi:DnaJ-class molecular chaperone